MSEIPGDVRLAIIREAKSWVLVKYSGGLIKLDAWDDNYAGLTSIRSNSMPGGTAKNLRRLVKLELEGVLIEKHRFPGRMRSFTLPRPELDHLGERAVRELQNSGYVVSQMMSGIEQEQGQ